LSVVDSGAPPPKWGVFAVQDVAEGCSRRWWLSGLSGGGGAGGATPRLLLWGFWLVKSNQHRPGQPGYGRGVVGGGTHARAAAQIGHFRPPGRQNPRLASSRTRPERPEKAGGYGGQSFSTTPPLPGPSRPLRGGRRGSCGGGSDPQVRPPPGDPPAAYLSTPGRPPFPRLSLRGLCGDPRGSAATPCTPAPAPGPGRAFPCAKVNFREGGGPAPPAEGASGSPPLEPQPQVNRRGQGQDPPFQSRASRKIAPSELTRMAGVEPSKRRTEGFRDSVRPPR
jgi:hypothetical protein